MRTVARMPSLDGGDARQGSVVWGGATGAGGHMTLGVDVLDREEIEGSAREHSPLGMGGGRDLRSPKRKT